MLSRALRAFFEVVLAWRVGIVLVLVGVTAAAVARLLPTDKLLVDFSLASLLVPDAASRAELADFQAAFGDDESVVAAVLVVPEGHTVFEPATVTALAELADWLRARPEVDPSAVVALPDLALLQGTIVPEALRKAPPTELAALGRALLAHHLYRGSLLSADGRATFIIGPLTRGTSSPDRQGVVIDAWAAALDAARDRFPSGSELLATGVPLVQSTYARLALRDIVVLIPVTILLIGVLLGFAFRRRYAVIAPLTAVGLATIWTLALIQATGTPFNIVNCVSGAVLLVVGVADGAHIIARHREEAALTADRREAVLATMTKMAPACFVTAATTAVGFASLATASLPVLRDFGIHLAIGVMLAYAAQILVMPMVLMAGKARPPATAASAAAAFVARVERVVIRRHRWLVVGALALGGVATFGLSRLESDARALGELRNDHPVARAVHLVEEHLAGVLAHAVELRGKRTGTACRHARDCGATQTCALRKPVDRAIEVLREPIALITGDASDPFLSELATRLRPTLGDDLMADDADQDELVGTCVESAADVAVLRALSEIATWLGAHDRRALVAKTTGLHDAVADTGLSDLHDELAVRERVAVLEASVPRLVARWLTPDHTRTQLHIAARDVGIDAWRELEPELIAFATATLARHGLTRRFDLTVTGGSTLAEKAMTGVLSDLAGSLVVDVTAILLFMILLFKSVRLAVLAMIPNLLPLVLVLGVMGLLGIEISASTVIVFSVALGIAVDDTIHFIHRYKEEALTHGQGEPAVRRTLGALGHPVAWTTAILVLGFLVNAFSELQAIADFGILSAITLVVALAIDLWLTPSLLLTFRGHRRAAPAATEAAMQIRDKTA